MEEVIIYYKVTNQFDASDKLYYIVHYIVLAITSGLVKVTFVLIHKNVKIENFLSDFRGEHLYNARGSLHYV